MRLRSTFWRLPLLVLYIKHVWADLTFLPERSFVTWIQLLVRFLAVGNNASPCYLELHAWSAANEVDIRVSSRHLRMPYTIGYLILRRVCRHVIYPVGHDEPRVDSRFNSGFGSWAS
jgi:hypothetical protein